VTVVIEEIRQFIIDVLKKLKYDTGDISGASSLGPAGLDLESLAVADLAVRIEDSFGIPMDDDELEHFAMMTIDEIAADIALRLSSRQN
jgi:acyl carrier protein